jgi:hypothetical protein
MTRRWVVDVEISTRTMKRPQTKMQVVRMTRKIQNQ